MPLPHSYLVTLSLPQSLGNLGEFSLPPFFISIFPMSPSPCDKSSPCLLPTDSDYSVWSPLSLFHLPTLPYSPHLSPFISSASFPSPICQYLSSPSWHICLHLLVSPFLGWHRGQEGGGAKIVAGGSLGGDWFLISTMEMMMQELRCHLIPCPLNPPPQASFPF